jgi:hypothetical protein
MFVLAFMLSTSIVSQVPPCDCAAAFDSVVAEVQRNYSGYRDKVTAQTRAEHEKLIAETRKLTLNANTSVDCQRVLSHYIAFFRDGHLRVSVTPQDTSGSAARRKFANWRHVDLSEADVRKRLFVRSHPVEGIWRSTVAPDYRVAILRNGVAAGDSLTAVVLDGDSAHWLPGQVKALLATADSGGYDTRFYLQDHTERTLHATLQRNVLRFSNGVVWVKEWPQAAGAVSRDQISSSLNSDFRVRQLNDHTVLIQIPSFYNDVSFRIDSLFVANEQKLRSTRDLIIDVRGNGGGSDYNYSRLLPLIYTKPMHTVNAATYATQDNMLRLAAIAEEPGLNRAVRNDLLRRIDLMSQHMGEFIPEPDFTTTFDSVMANPRRVAIIMDHGCASTCEQFILTARQSDKVTLYGENTAGILDYANLLAAPLNACADLTLRYPSTRSKRLPHDPVDPVGIAPTVRIPPDELFPIDWVVQQMSRSQP